MENLIPKLDTGRMVRYVLSEEDCEAIRTARCRFQSSTGHPSLAAGNDPCPGDVVPAIVVVPWSDTMFNGQAFLDGNDRVWLTSVNLDQDEKKPGTWHWPEFAESKSEEEEPEQSISGYGKPFGKGH